MGMGTPVSLTAERRLRQRPAGGLQHPGRDRRRSGLRQRQRRDQGRRAASDRQPGDGCLRRSNRSPPCWSASQALQRRGGQLADRAVPGEGRDAVHRRSRPDVRLGRRRHLRRPRGRPDACGRSPGTGSGCPTSAASSTAANSPACSRPGTMTARRWSRRSSSWPAPISASCSQGSGLTGIGRHHRFAVGQRQVGRGAGRLAVGLGSRHRQGCAHSRHQSRTRCRRCWSAPTGSAARSMRRARRPSRRRSCLPEPSSAPPAAHRLHRCGRRAARPARHARRGQGVAVGRSQDRVRHRRGRCGRHGHLCGGDDARGRIGRRPFGSRVEGPLGAMSGQIRHRAAGAVPDPARAGAGAGARRGAAVGAARKAAAAARGALLRVAAVRARQGRRGRCGRPRKRRGRRPRPSARPRRRRRLAEEARREAEEQAKADARKRQGASEAGEAGRPRPRKAQAAEAGQATGDDEARRKAEEAAKADGRGGAAQGQRGRPKRKAVEDGKRKAAEEARRKAEEATRLAEEERGKAHVASGSQNARHCRSARDAPQSSGETGRPLRSGGARRIPEIAWELSADQVLRPGGSGSRHRSAVRISMRLASAMDIHALRRAITGASHPRARECAAPRTGSRPLAVAVDFGDQRRQRNVAAVRQWRRAGRRTAARATGWCGGP